MKTKLVALSGLCAAISTACLVFAGLPAIRWAFLFLSVIASISIVIPYLVGNKIVYSVLTYIVSCLLGGFLGINNIVYIVPTIVFFAPFAIIKAYGESFKSTTATTKQEVQVDPFDDKNDELQQQEQVAAKPKKRIPTWLKWVLYYILLEAGIALTLLCAKLLAPSLWDTVMANSIWVLLAIFQLMPLAYDILLRGCFVTTNKVLRKVNK